MKRLICAVFASILVFSMAFMVVGCGNSEVAGTYVATSKLTVVNEFTATLVLKRSGSCSIKKAAGSQVLDEYSGTYSVDDDKVITFNFTWENELGESQSGEYTGSVLSNGNIKFRFFGSDLTFKKQ